MAITDQQKESLLGVTSFMFNYAPDQASFERFEAIIENNPSFYALGTDLALTEAYTSQFEEGATLADKIDLILGRLGLEEGSQGYERGTNFITQRLEDGIPEGQVLMEIGEKLLQETPPEGLEDAAAVLRNKITVSEAYLESGIEGYSNDTMPDLLAGITADPQSVEDALAAIEDGPVDLSGLTEAVAAYQTALNDQSEALTALNEFAEESETFDGTFEATEESANSAIELAKDNLAAEQATLAAARASADYDAALDAADATDTGDATADFLSEELNDRALSDARLQQALEAAEANVDESEVQYIYTDADGDAVEAVDAQDSLVYQLEDGDYTADGDADGAELVGYLVDEDGAPADASADGALDDPEVASFVSSRDLLNNVVAAENALNSDIAANGETLDLAGELSDAIGSYLSRNEGLAGGELEALQDAYLDAIAEDAGDVELTALSAAVTSAYDALFDEDGEAVEDALEEGERADAVLNLLAEAQERVELEANVATAEAAFVSTPEGEILRDIQALDELRQADIEDVNQAEADLAEVTDLAEALKAAIDEVEGAATLLEEEYGVENLIELTNQGNEGGVRDEGDIYLVSEDTETTTLTRFEADDRLFIGGDYELVALGDDEMGDRVGFVDQLEVFWEQNGSNLTLYIETEAAAGFDTGAAALDNVTQITLNGVNGDNVSFENGFLSVVEVA